MNHSKIKKKVCIVNVGLFRSGTTTLAEASKSLGFNIYRKFPSLSSDQCREFLHDPQQTVLAWFKENGLREIIQLATEYDLICDRWIALLPLLPFPEIDRLEKEAMNSGIHLELVASNRDTEAVVKSELQHWIVHGLEAKAALQAAARDSLEDSLRTRANQHKYGVERLHALGKVWLLPLEDHLHVSWSKVLTHLSPFTEKQWSTAFCNVGKCNKNPPLPIQGVLLTCRLSNNSHEIIHNIGRLLDQIECDALCRYLVVLAIDDDEDGSDEVKALCNHIKSREGPNRQLKSFHVIINPPKNPSMPFSICSAWHKMATIAWKNGADWVVLLGDDIEIQCSYHYRAIYRSFLDIAERLNVPFGFGCPWFNDLTFPGFPTFPCVGKTHYQLYAGLIPKDRLANFVNQDLDPYLYRLYTKFLAAPCVSKAKLFNVAGGNIGNGQKSRYERVPAIGWKDFVNEDIKPIRNYVPKGTVEAILLDVVVPSYRVRLDYLQSICSLKVPSGFQTTFIIIIDNPDALLLRAATISGNFVDKISLNQAEQILEEYLSSSSCNNVRVRCNESNLGASASRNRGLDESAAEFILNLDDDLIPQDDLLMKYGKRLKEIDDTVVGLVGLVRFPRSPALPLKHAAVLMSYLAFMFEIAESANDLYKRGPAWGVTANILFRRTSVRFDKVYAKTGGGEDVDFALRVASAHLNGKGRLLPVPEACVVHPFWPGSVLTLMSHFFNWAVGDGALLKRFPEYRYVSFPNLPETLLLFSPLLLFWFTPFQIVTLILRFIVADFLIDFSNQSEYKNRCRLLQSDRCENKKLERHPMFYMAAHALANLYVIVLECGRLYGHLFLRQSPWQMICRRFDWHCGYLKNAPSNFRQREAQKFGLFVGIVLWELQNISREST